FDITWRPSDYTGDQTVKCSATGKWVPLPKAAFVIVDDVVAEESNIVALPSSSTSLNVAKASQTACTTANAILTCLVPLKHAEKFWPHGEWRTIDLLHKGRSTFGALAWITERVPALQ